MKKNLRVGVIGLGLGRMHLAGYARNEEVNVIGLADVDAGRLRQCAKQYGIANTFTTYRELLKLKPDLVSVCLPNYLHARAAIDALKAGAHVLCEKPMATNAAEAQRMVNAAHRSERFLMIALNNRFRTEAQKLKKLIEQSALGEIYYAKTGWMRRRGIPGAGSWFTQKAKSGGGPLIDLGVHMIDLTRWLMGNPAPVSLTGAVYAKFGHTVPGPFDVEDLATAFIKLDGGITLIAEASWATHVPSETAYVKLMGTQGGAEISGNKLTVYTEMYGELVDVTPAYHPRSWEDCLAAEIAHFVECIRAGKTPMSTGEQGLEMMKILKGIYKSAEQEKTVKIS